MVAKPIFNTVSDSHMWTPAGNLCSLQRNLFKWPTLLLAFMIVCGALCANNHVVVSWYFAYSADRVLGRCRTSMHVLKQPELCLQAQLRVCQYLWQYHSPWQREHLFLASLPQDPHFGFSGSKLSITSKLYVWASLVKTSADYSERLSRFSVPSLISQTCVFSVTSGPVVSSHFQMGWMFLWLDTLLLPSTFQNSHW